MNRNVSGVQALFRGFDRVATAVGVQFEAAGGLAPACKAIRHPDRPVDDISSAGWFRQVYYETDRTAQHLNDCR